VSVRTCPCAIGEGSGNPLDESEHSLSRYDPERGGDGSRPGDDVTHENAGVRRGERGASQIRTGEGDVDGGSGVAGIRREGPDRRYTDATGIAGDGE